MINGSLNEYVPETVVRITTPTFVIGVVLAGGTVIRAAPIVRYMSGWTLAQIDEHCRSKGWKTQLL